MDRIEKVHRERITRDSLCPVSKEILSKANKNGRFCISYNIPIRKGFFLTLGAFLL